MDRDATKSLNQNEKPAERKARLRQFQREQSSNLTPPDREEQSSSIRKHIWEFPMWASSTNILAFMPLKDEPDISSLLKDILKTGKQLFLPRYNANTQSYDHARIEDVSSDLSIGNYGIMEPSNHCSSLDPLHMDLTLVPGLAFDSEGWRLGRGKGFYDRMLASLGGIYCGIAFNFQLVESVPHETLDQKMDWIITPEGAMKTAIK